MEPPTGAASPPDKRHRFQTLFPTKPPADEKPARAKPAASGPAAPSGAFMLRMLDPLAVRMAGTPQAACPGDVRDILEDSWDEFVKTNKTAKNVVKQAPLLGLAIGLLVWTMQVLMLRQLVNAQRRQSVPPAPGAQPGPASAAPAGAGKYDMAHPERYADAAGNLPPDLNGMLVAAMMSQINEGK